MKRSLVVIVLLGAGVVGFYRGWFSLGSDSGGGSANVTLSVDKDKFQEDRESATRGVQGLGRQAKDRATGPAEKITDGTMVSVKGGSVTIADKEGKEHRRTLAADVKVTCDARPCEAADLKAGMRVRVTTGDDVPHAATRVEAIDMNAAFEKIGG